jgi:hypothetical protein
MDNKNIAILKGNACGKENRIRKANLYDKELKAIASDTIQRYIAEQKARG